MKQHLILRSVDDEADHREVVAAAAADGHAHLEPTGYFTRGGEIVGAINLGRLVVCHAWLRRDLGARGVVQAVALMESLARDRRYPALAIPVGPESAMHAKLGHFGYVPWLAGTVFAKVLNAENGGRKG